MATSMRPPNYAQKLAMKLTAVLVLVSLIVPPVARVHPNGRVLGYYHEFYSRITVSEVIVPEFLAIQILAIIVIGAAFVWMLSGPRSVPLATPGRLFLADVFFSIALLFVVFSAYTHLRPPTAPDAFASFIGGAVTGVVPLYIGLRCIGRRSVFGKTPTTQTETEAQEPRA